MIVKRRIIKFISLVGFTALTVTVCAIGTIDRTVARLNEDIITESDITAVYSDEQGNFKNPYTHSVIDVVTSSTIGSVFDNILLKQYAKKLGVKIPQDDINNQVDDMVAEIRSKFSSEQEFRAALAKDGLSIETLQTELQKKAKDDFLIYTAINSRFSVTAKDVKDFEATEGKDSLSYLSLKLRRIGVPVTKGVNQSEAFEKVKSLVEKGIREGLNFEETVRNYSQIPHAAEDGGDLGYISMDKLSANVQNVVKDLSPGQASRPVVAGGYANIFYVEGRRGSKSHLTKKMFEDNRKSLLASQRHKANLAIFDERLYDKIPEEYRGLIKGIPAKSNNSLTTSSRNVLNAPISPRAVSQTPAQFYAQPQQNPNGNPPVPAPTPERRKFGIFRRDN